MAKSFCNGCRHWQWCDAGWDGEPNKRFRFCDRYSRHDLWWRKKICNGEYWEEEK